MKARQRLRHSLPSFAFIACVFLSALPSFAQPFLHPGGLHTQTDLDRMKAKVAAAERPWIDSWNALLTNPKAQSTYNPAPQANMGASRQRASADAVAAYLNAIRGYVAGSVEHTDNAIRICNLWSAAVNQVPSGTDQPGLSGLYCYQFAVVGELLRIHVGTRWAQEDFDRFKNMLSQYLYPICHDFLVRHNNTCFSHYWANWDASNVAAIAAIGVVCDNRPMFDEAVEYFKNGAGNGSIRNAIYALHPGGPDRPYGLGQWQETGRDQEHNVLGVGLLATVCQIAWNQGVDLYAHDNHRLLAGAEYVARFALWEDVPYTVYDNCDDVNQYWSSDSLRGLLQRPIWEQLYNHYVVRLGLPAPGVASIAALNRPEGFTHDDHFGYGTLAYTLDASASPLPSAAPSVQTALTATPGVGRAYLEWTPVPGATGYAIRRATNAGGPFITVSNQRGTRPQFTDTAVTNGVSYVYRVAPSNQIGDGPDSASASATPQAAGPPPSGWIRRDIGTNALPGNASFAAVSGGTFLVAGSGSGIGGTADGMSYTFSAVSGDATLTARLAGGSVTGVGSAGRLGLMFRESLAPNARTQAIIVGDAGFRVARYASRSSTGGNTVFVNGNAYSGLSEPSWFRLQRTGNTFTAFQSKDGIVWHQVGSTTVAMADSLLVGFAVGSASANAILAEFENVSVTGNAMPAPPASLSALNGHSQVALSWTAAPGATAYDLKRAKTAGGPYAVIAAGLTSTSYVDAGLSDGTSYHYVLSSRLGDYESVNSEETVGVPGDITSVWSPTPVSGSWSVGANWLGGTSPESGSSLTFGASTITALVNDLPGLAIRRLSFNASAPAFTLTGNALSVSGDIANLGASAQTISHDLVLSDTLNVVAQGGPISLRGTIGDGGSVRGFVKSGPQTLSISGQNTFSGDVRLTAGAVSIAGIGTGIPGFPATGALGRGTVRLAGGTLTSSAAATIYNPVVVETGTTTNISSASANITFAGNISGGGNLNESGANTGGTHFNGDNSGFSGTFTSSNATNHRVRFNSPHAGSAAATWVLNNSQTDGYGLNFGTGTIHFGALSGGGQFRNDAALNTTATLRIGALNTNTTFSGIMVANSTRFIAVQKVGSGRLTFTGAHTYDGPTAVLEGTLLVNGSLRSAVAVSSGATFGGSGSSTTPVSINAGGTLAPGNLAIGTFTTAGALTLQPGASLALELNATTRASDKIVAASVSLGGALLSMSDPAPATLPSGAVFAVIENTGAAPVVGIFSGLPEGSVLPFGSQSLRISYSGGTGNDVTLTAIEPAPVITSATSASAIVGQPFSYLITATNSPTIFFANDLPAGLSVNPLTGAITGTPVLPGAATIALGAANSVGTGTAMLTLTVLRSGQAAYNPWIGTQSLPADQTGPDSDPDVDGQSNLQEFVCATPPAQAGAETLAMQTATDAGVTYPAIRYIRRRSIGDIAVNVQAAPDLEFSSDFGTVPVSVEPRDEHTDWIVVRSTRPLDAGLRQFFRLTITLP